ncbi:hypothetical protein NGM10_08810 [Halorussus salilacus]|uniref:hypothetical protein n=1 Tax=Halorussus salilacus TaxID=2953750 RepID=UPI0020A14515|nr:hypothetical protein [Halorussus salilacus]USZ66831.1 hypothetical protein NGM10_08810 [Halorussus salilacus]
MADSESGHCDRKSEEREGDVEVLQSGREEARIVLDHQLRFLSEIHTKALRTVRITILVFGLVLSATAFPRSEQYLNAFTVAGVGSLAMSILFGLVTYSVSNSQLGVGPNYLLDARTMSYRESEWLDLLLSGYSEWIADMERLNDSTIVALTTTQLFLGVGIVLLVVGFVNGLNVL